MLKFYWEYSAILAAAFWCGLKWRRATRAGAWASMLTAFMMYLALPIGLPLLFPHMRVESRFLARTQERTSTQTYRVSQRDVEERQREIASWSAPGNPPPALRTGEPVERLVAVPPRAVFWAQGIREVEGIQRGEGVFYPEMFLLGQLTDLTANAPALNETIRYAYKILLPFLVLIVVSLCKTPDESSGVQRFFLRLRTKVSADRHQDELAVQAAYANPESTRVVLLFPNTTLELFKWDKEDILGFLAACLVALAIMAWLFLVLQFGA
jgi:SSS family solute:Na+ symporter